MRVAAQPGDGTTTLLRSWIVETGSPGASLGSRSSLTRQDAQQF